MQQRKFYGKSMKSALAEVREALGEDALIIKTRELIQGSSISRINDNARYEIVASKASGTPAEMTAKRSTTASAPSQFPAQNSAMAINDRSGLSLASDEKETEGPTVTYTRPKSTASRSSRIIMPTLETRLDHTPPNLPVTEQTLSSEAPPRSPATVKLNSLWDKVAAKRSALAAAEELVHCASTGKSFKKVAKKIAEADALTTAAEIQAAVEAANQEAAQTQRKSQQRFVINDDDFIEDTPKPLQSMPILEESRLSSKISRTPFAEPTDEMSDHLAAISPINPKRGGNVLEDMGLLRSQLSTLSTTAGPVQEDLKEYNDLIRQGVDHTILAPHFRSWLRWRTASAEMRKSIAMREGGPASMMQEDSLREWLWLVWSETQGCFAQQPRQSLFALPRNAPKMVAFVGATGAGKTTALAKAASISRHIHGQKAAVLTLDSSHPGANEIWRYYADALDIDVEEIVTPDDLRHSTHHWDEWDWIGIDTPGSMTRDTQEGHILGSILAKVPTLDIALVLSATQHEAINRDQMQQWSALDASSLLVSKVDETTYTGGVLNVTMDGRWHIDGFSCGPVAPNDWMDADAEALWSCVMAPRIPTHLTSTH